MSKWKRQRLNRSQFVADYGAEILSVGDKICRFQLKFLQYGFEKETWTISPNDDDLEDILNAACFYGNLNFLLFLKQFYNQRLLSLINGCETQDKFTNPLCEAIKMCRTSVVAFLLAHGADPLFKLSSGIAPLHYALSKPVQARSEHYKHFCEGDPIFALQMLFFYLPDGFDATTSLSKDGIDTVGGIHTELVAMARSRDAADAKDLLADAVSWTYSPDEMHPLEQAELATSNEDDDSQTAQYNCGVCKTRFQSGAVLKSHLQSRKHKRKAKEQLNVRVAQSETQRARQGLSMTRWVRINQEGASEFLSLVPEELQVFIFGLLGLADRRSLAVSCKYANRILQRGLLWKSLGSQIASKLTSNHDFTASDRSSACLGLDFTTYGDILNNNTIRTFLEGHLTKLTSLKTWSDGHNFMKFYKKSSIYGFRYPDIKYLDPFDYWTVAPRVPIDCDAQTLHLIPTLCKSLISLEVNTADISWPWILKLLSRNTSLTELRLNCGLLVSPSNSAIAALPQEDMTFPLISTFHLALTAHAAAFSEPLGDECECWRRPFFPADHLWRHECEESMADARLDRLIRLFPNLKHLGLDIGGWHPVPQQIVDAIKSLTSLESLSVTFSAPDNSVDPFLDSLFAQLGNSAVFPSLQTLRLADCTTAWTECPVSVTSVFDGRLKLLTGLRCLELDCYHTVDPLSILTSLSHLTRLSIESQLNKKPTYLDELGPILPHLSQLVELELQEQIGSRGTYGNYAKSNRALLIIGELLTLKRASIKAHFLIDQPQFDLTALIPRPEIHESLCVTLHHSSIDCFMGQLSSPSLEQLTHLSIELLHDPDTGYHEVNPVKILKHLPHLEELQIFASMQDTYFREPFYHVNLKYLWLSVLSIHGKSVAEVSERLIENLAYSLPRLEKLRISAARLNNSSFVLLDFACGFPSLVEFRYADRDPSSLAKISFIHADKHLVLPAMEQLR